MCRAAAFEELPRQNSEPIFEEDDREVAAVKKMRVCYSDSQLIHQPLNDFVDTFNLHLGGFDVAHHAISKAVKTQRRRRQLESPSCKITFGSILVLLAGAMLSALGGCLVQLDAIPGGASMPTVDILFVRGITSTLISVLVSFKNGRALFPPSKLNTEDAKDGYCKLIFLAYGIVSFSVSGTLYCALARLPLSIAIMISYTDPLFCGCFGSVLLKEKFRFRGIAIASLSVVGAIISCIDWHGCCRNQHLDEVGIVSAILNSILQGLRFAMSRYMSKCGAQGTHQAFAVGLTTVVVSLAWAAATSQVSFVAWSWWTGLITIGITICANGAMACNIVGLAVVPASLAAVISQLCVVFATFWGVLLLGQRPGPTHLIGIGIQILSSIMFVYDS